MTLKEAKKINKEFTQNGRKITPQLSDDWTYSFDTYYNSDDKIIIHSEKLNIRVFISIGINSFFKDFIYNKKLLIDGNKLVGSFSFSKYNIYLEDEFLEAQRVIEDESLKEVIPNDELIEFGVYLDDKGDKYVYLGNYEPIIYSINKNSDIYIASNSRKSTRYIVKYNDEMLEYTNYMIQKNSSRKFIDLISVLNLQQKNKFKEKLLFDRLFNAISFGDKNGNNLEVFYDYNRDIYSNHFIKNNDMFGFYSSEYNYSGPSTFTFYEVDFEKVKKDILNNTFKNFDDYVINIHGDFEINKDNSALVKVYVSYE